MTFLSAFIGALLMMKTLGPSESVPFDSGRWRWSAAASRVEDHLGRRSLYLEKGIATVADAHFTNGWIEFDVAFTGERGFMGGIWRVQDTKNYEEFYLRPHQSGNPDASQYTPVFHGIEGWQLYHGERYTVSIVHRFDEWTHVKILFSGTRAEIYVRDMENPVLFVDPLKRDVAEGTVGVNAGLFAAAYFSNFSFNATDSPPFKGRSRRVESAPQGVIPSWWISDAFPESFLADKVALGQADLSGLGWTHLKADSGLADLARAHGLDLPRNTVFARKVIVSRREQVKRLDFGFCDRIKVYLNKRLLFRGDDTPRSRDYRFLGSIGYFDSLYLPLDQGENELLMAVTEEVGGWGIQAKLADLAGVSFQE
ncbi:MAG TPA: hypothetical protein VN783_15745 [Thermoanaerobaculia bacterium]|nr:hypothetical protein [Thermoanaerobaculia bacterium]